MSQFFGRDLLPTSRITTNLQQQNSITPHTTTFNVGWQPTSGTAHYERPTRLNQSQQQQQRYHPYYWDFSTTRNVNNLDRQTVSYSRNGTHLNMLQGFPVPSQKTDSVYAWNWPLSDMSPAHVQQNRPIDNQSSQHPSWLKNSHHSSIFYPEGGHHANDTAETGTQKMQAWLPAKYGNAVTSSGEHATTQANEQTQQWTHAISAAATTQEHNAMGYIMYKVPRESRTKERPRNLYAQHRYEPPIYIGSSQHLLETTHLDRLKSGSVGKLKDKHGEKAMEKAEQKSSIQEDLGFHELSLENRAALQCKGRSDHENRKVVQSKDTTVFAAHCNDHVNYQCDICGLRYSSTVPEPQV